MIELYSRGNINYGYEPLENLTEIGAKEPKNRLKLFIKIGSLNKFSFS